MSTNLDLSSASLKRLKIYSKWLLFTGDEDAEQRLGICRGRIAVISSHGDMDVLCIVYAMIIARVSLIADDRIAPGDQIHVDFVYPSTFDRIDLVKNAIEYHLDSTGDANRLDLRYIPVSTIAETMDTISLIDDCDVYFNFYVDFFLEDSHLTDKFIGSIKEKKDGKFIILNRFNRKKKI